MPFLNPDPADQLGSSTAPEMPKNQYPRSGSGMSFEAVPPEGGRFASRTTCVWWASQEMGGRLQVVLGDQVLVLAKAAELVPNQVGAFVPPSPSRVGAGVRRHGLGSRRVHPVHAPMPFETVRAEGSTLARSELRLPKTHGTHQFIHRRPVHQRLTAQERLFDAGSEAFQGSWFRTCRFAACSFREHRGPKQMLALRVSALTSGALYHLST